MGDAHIADSSAADSTRQPAPTRRADRRWYYRRLNDRGAGRNCAVLVANGEQPARRVEVDGRDSARLDRVVRPGDMRATQVPAFTQVF